MPTLNWIGKEAVVRHDAEVPFRLLHDVPELACRPSPAENDSPPPKAGESQGGGGQAQNTTDNLIVEGDNLLALKALLPHYGGQVKCIYIDPPYNTGNEGWVYNDAVNSPEMREWLGKVVGREAEDLTRHDKWLCMMYPRLKLLKLFLREDGAIFVSIDDNEAAALRMVMDEIFGKQNFITTVLWQKIFSPKNSARHFSEDHDYVVVYAVNAERWKPNLLPRGEDAIARYKNPDNDTRGPWTSGDLQARNFYSEGTYPITCPTGRVIPGPGKGMYWRVSKTKFDEMNREGRIFWGEGGNNMPRLKRYLADVRDGVIPQTLWFHRDVGHTQEAKKELLELVAFETSDEVFITPKPTRLLQRILQIASDKDSLILDSFAGSGSTGHAVLKQNAEDGGNRRFILVEMDENIARNVTAERVKRVLQGYTNAKGESIAGLGGGFRYATLGKPLFAASGHINPEVTFAELARFVWFMETGVPWSAEPLSPQPSFASGRGGKTLSPLLGVHEGRAVYLLYNGILKDKSAGGGNVLTSPLLAELPTYDGPKTIYGARCLIKPERLRKLGIVFKQLPYELKVAR